MPVYGNNSIVLACKSDDKVGYAISAPAAGTTYTQITFAFTAGQKFSSRGATGLLTNTFPTGQSVWADSIRISIPNLQRAINANGTVATAPGGAFFYIRPANGVDGNLTANNIIGNTTALDEWIPINAVSPKIPLTSAGIYFEPVSLTVDVDFRNTDLTVFSGITIFAYLELQVNCITKPS